MTSPRTPRLLDWTVPNHLKAWVEGADIRVACMHFHAADTTTTSVPLGDDDAQMLIGHFLRDHAHGATVEYRPLSEVLPETPEPPQVDAVPLEVYSKHQYNTRQMREPDQLEDLCTCGEWVSDWLEHHAEEAAKLHAPVPASQSVPAVPVSSTGGKETGEGSEEPQGAAEVDWTEEPRFADFREAYDYATIHFSAAIRAHAKVDRREAYQIWHTIQLGMEKIQRERSPLPDSETEWGYRRVGEPDSYTRRTTEAAARDTAARASTGPWVVCKRTAAGPWIEVGS